MTTIQFIFAIIGAMIGVSTITVTVMGIVLKRTKKKGIDAHRLDIVEGKVNTLQCVHHNTSVVNIGQQLNGVLGTLNEHSKFASRIDSLHLDLAKVREDVSFIRGLLNARNKGINAFGFTGNNSPMQLNDRGREFVTETKLDDRIYSNWEAIEALLDVSGMKTAYDIDQYCLQRAVVSPEQFLKEEDVIFLKNKAFSTGDKLESYAGMIGVIVRNRYFQKKGINIEDIDKQSI